MAEETMKDFEEQINQSFRSFREGDIVKGLAIAVSEDEINVDLATYSQGVIYSDEYSDDQAFHAMDEIRVGEEITAMVLEGDDGMGRVVLSLKQAREVEAWEALREGMAAGTVYTVKVTQAVNAGVIAYVEGLRGFIPASGLALTYVEEPEEYVGKKLQVKVITADEDKRKLVLSAKEVLKAEAEKEHEDKLNALQKGYVTEGVIDRIEPYGCFVTFGEGLTGLVHISQICGKFLHSPNEVVKLGQTVRVKILEIADGKIKLSMKDAEDLAPEIAEAEEAETIEYESGEEATTSLAGLLAGIKLD